MSRTIAFIVIITLQSVALTGQVRHITVAADGSGEFTSVQEAVNSIRAYMSDTTYMHIRAGVYREKIVIPSWVTNLFMKGEGADKTVITWDDYAGLRNMGTFRTYTIWIQGAGFTAEDITFENSAGPVGQAVAVHADG
ncbi:MAG: pectinesterase family protein, partial [Bacteroidales bacterium]|nr:pectinesterase family protein [Bacteroidales bacterium]